MTIAPSIPGFTPETGCLPHGRYPCTLEEMQWRFVTNMNDASGHRARIWEDFERATRAIRSVAPVASVWVGGSFVTDIPSPSDIDVVYLVRANEYDAITDQELKKRLNMFRGGKKLFNKNMLVDSYVLDWRPRGSERPVGNSEQEAMANRGYWDDWFQRKRVDGMALDDDRNAIPRRGYLEVILDGYIT